MSNLQESQLWAKVQELDRSPIRAQKHIGTSLSASQRDEMIAAVLGWNGNPSAGVVTFGDAESAVSV